MLLYIIRHADPIYDPDSLTPRGHMQARALAKRLCVSGLDEIYSSPMLRARQTAQPAAELLGLEVNIEEWAREVWPEFTLTYPDGSMKFAMDIDNTRLRAPDALAAGDDWHKLPDFSTINGKQEYDNVVRNSDGFIARLGYERQSGVYFARAHSEKRVAIFCHGGLMSVWLSHLLCVPPLVFWAGFTCNHSGVTILEWKPNREGFVAPRCLCVSDISHLLAAGLPYRFSNGVSM